MNIEAGKFYRTRDGRKAGPMKSRFVYGSRYPWEANLNRPFDGADYGFIFDASGKNYAHDELDIVTEWQDAGPVRTVTRREIVPGRYGRASINSVFPEEVGIAFDTLLDAADLRAAAALFTELADVLDEQKEVG